MGFRPHQSKGEPLPWDSNHGLKINYKPKCGDVTEIGKVTEKAFKKIKEWTEVRCGGQSADEREKGLARLLTYDIAAKENEWITYDREETQIKLDLCDMILDTLFDEIVYIMTD